MDATDRSEDVLNLIDTVGKLPREDQARILRIADLLAMASSSVQDRTQRMLTDLLHGRPQSKTDCLASIDEVIAYLEQAVDGGEDALWIRHERRTIVGNA